MSIRSRRAVRAISGALLALMLVVPGTVSAAVPTLVPTWTVIPTTVQDGEYVAFRGSIRNADTSTVSQLFLVERTRDPNLTLVPGTVSSSQGSCNVSGATFVCTLGQLKPNRTATVSAVFQAAVLDPAAPYTATGQWEFNTTGLGSGGGDNSHGDSWPSRDSNGAELLTANVTNSDDFGGRYVLNSGLLVVENSQLLGNGNPHSTRAYSPVTGIGVTVEDIDCGAPAPDPVCVGLSGGFGQVSKINVNDDRDDGGITSTTLLHFYIQLDSSEIPQGTNANHISVLHVYPTGSETISTRCTFAKKATVPNNGTCIAVTKLSGGDLGIDVWTTHNGGLRVQA